MAQAIQARVVPHLTPTITGLQPAPDVRNPALPALIDGLIADAEVALTELRAVVHGLFPPLLQRRGLVLAPAAQLEHSHPKAALAVDGIDGRLDPVVEAAAYLVCIKVAPNERPCQVRLGTDAHELRVVITWDDGTEPGRDLPAHWQRAIDRVEALDGTVTMDNNPDPSQHAVRAEIPPSPGQDVYPISASPAPSTG